VRAEQRGRLVPYRLADERIGRLLAFADELLAGTACGLPACVHYEAPEEG
jgi:hypothetical protein